MKLYNMNIKLMIRSYFSLILLIWANSLLAQSVTTNPENPVPSQAVTVTFDATGSELEGYTGEVYVHTGVTIEGVGDWQYVIGDWGENSTQPQAERIGADLYEIVLSPSINEYYQVQSGDVVTELCMVFRSADASMQSRPDFFIPVYSEQGLRITSPDPTAIFSLGDDIQIEAVALFATEMTLYVNEIEQTTVAANELSYTYTANQAGYNTIRITGTDGSETVEDSSYFFVREANTIADLPAADLQDGINYIDDNTVTLVLYAPFKDFVFVKGSFNNWELTQDNQLAQTPDGKRYWITLDGLTAGQEYIYQYIIDGEIIIADPYCDKISDPWNDHYISNNTYPDLIEYPSDYASGIASVFQTAQEPYQWQTQDFVPPDNEDLVIYELLVRDFVAAHDYQTLIDTLDYLENLGINAIELMPVSEFEGNSSWGYNPSFYFAPDKYYGPKNDLKAFIDSCHSRGIAVILDMVLNHSYGQSPLVQMYFDPNAGDYGQPTPENPWYNETSPNSAYSWGFDFDHESQDTKDFVDRVNAYWLEEYKFDGFRFDFTKGFTNTPGDGWPYDAARIAILKRMADEIWAVNPNAYVILEHFAENNEEIELSDYGMLIWGNVNHAYSEASMGWPGDWDFSWASYQERGWNMPHLVSYMESHDEERMMYRNITYGNSSGSYDVTELETALDRVKLASVFFLTMPGPKMLWQFEELGYDISIDDPCRVCEKPILWNYYDTPERYTLYQFMSNLIELRKTYDVFTTNDFTIDASGIIKEMTLSGDTMNVHIIGNFGIEDDSFVPDFANQGTWYEYFSGTEISPPFSVTMAPGEYRLYTDKEMPGFEYAAPPVAESVSFSGNLTVGDTLFGSYVYSDPNDDPEGVSKMQWYSAANEAGAGTDPISGATQNSLVLSNDLKDKFIAFGVTPVADSETAAQGDEVRSGFQGPVTGFDGLSLYPNPVFGGELNLIGIDAYTQLIIYDLYGKKMFEYELSGQPTLTLDISVMQAGTYLFKFSGPESSEVRKITVTNK